MALEVTPPSGAPANVDICPIRLPEERDLFAGLSVATFSPCAPGERTRAFWGGYITGLPYFEPGDWIGAFDGADYIGGVAIYRRIMRVGAARLPVGCVASLTVRSGFRGRGIGERLLRSAEARALSRGDVLVLLHGIPDFYRRQGYADVLDGEYLRVSRAALASAKATAQDVQSADASDAPALLDLYETHFGSRVGSFERDHELQRYFLDARIRDDCPVVARRPGGRIEGYLIFNWSRKAWKVEEAVAESWPAALALMRHAAGRLDQLGRSEDDVIIPAPRDSSLAMAVADNVWCRHETEHDSDAGWMARVINPGGLVSALGPELNRRLSSERCEPTSLCLTIDGAGPYELQSAPPGRAARPGAVSGAVLAQLVFGYRPAGWLAGQPGCDLDSGQATALNYMFRPEGAWIAGTDAF